MESHVTNHSFIKTLGKIFILFIASFFIITLSNIGIDLIFKIVYSMFNDTSQLSADQLNKVVMQNPIFLAAASISSIVFVIFLIIFTKKIDKLDFKAVLFAKLSKKNHMIMLMYGAVIALLTIIVFILFGTGLQMLTYSTELSLNNINGRLFAFLISGIVFSFITAFCEEIFFRGYILNQFLKWNRKYAILISSFIFMLAEVPGTVLPIDLIGYFLTGIFFGYLYMTTSSLFITIGIHSTLNFILLNIVTFDKYDYGLPTLFTFTSQEEFTFGGIQIATTVGFCTFFVNALSIIILYIYHRISNYKLKSSIAK